MRPSRHAKKWEIAECSPLPPLYPVRQPGLGKGGREEGRGTSCQKGMDTPPLPPSSWSWGHTVGRRRRRGSGGGGKGEWSGGPMQGEGDATGRREEEQKRLVRLRRRRRRRRGSERTPAPEDEISAGGVGEGCVCIFLRRKIHSFPPPPPSIFFPSKSEGRKETSGCRRFGFGPKKGRGGHWSQ